MDATDATGEERRVSEESRDTGALEGMTVAEAARLLGISEGAVRKRVERGKLAAEHGADGRLIVYPEDAPASATTTNTTHDTTHDRPRQSREPRPGDRYTRSLEDRVEDLREQLHAEREANRENRRIIAALTSRIPELPPASTQEPREPPETVADEQQGRGPAPDTTGSQQEPAEPRSWWRRLFGG